MKKTPYLNALDSYRARMMNGEVLSPSARIVLYSIITRMGEKDYAFPSQAAIAQENGLSIESVKRAVKELKTKGYISRIGHMKGNTPGRPINVYYPDTSRAKEYQPPDNKVSPATPYPDELSVIPEQLSVIQTPNKVSPMTPVKNKEEIKEYIYGSIISEVKKESPRFYFSPGCIEKLKTVMSEGITEANITKSIITYVKAKPDNRNLKYWEYEAPPTPDYYRHATYAGGECRLCKKRGKTDFQLHMGFCEECRPIQDNNMNTDKPKDFEEFVPRDKAADIIGQLKESMAAEHKLPADNIRLIQEEPEEPEEIEQEEELAIH